MVLVEVVVVGHRLIFNLRCFHIVHEWAASVTNENSASREAAGLWRRMLFSNGWLASWLAAAAV